jgi:hypothetical protein
MRSVLPAVVSVLALALAGCGDSDPEPASADAADTASPSSPSETPTETPTETPSESATPSEPASATPEGPLVLEDGRIDLCMAVSIDDLADATGWTAVESSDYVGEGSCEWEFVEADLSMAYDEYSTVDELREQSQNFELEELDGVGDGGFLQLAPKGYEITPESAGVVFGSGEWVLAGGAIENDDSLSVDDLAEGAEALARACAAVL